MDRQENERALRELALRLAEHRTLPRLDTPNAQAFFDWYTDRVGITDERGEKEARRLVERVVRRFERANLPLPILKEFYERLGLPLEAAGEVVIRCAKNFSLDTNEGRERFLLHCQALIRVVSEIKDTSEMLKGQSQNLMTLSDLIMSRAEHPMAVEVFTTLYAELVRLGLTSRQIRELVEKHPEVCEPEWAVISVGLCFFGRRAGWSLDQIRELVVDALSMSEEEKKLLEQFGAERAGELLKKFLERRSSISVCVYLRLLVNFGPEETEILLTLTDDKTLLKKLPEVLVPLKVPLRTVLQGFESCRGKVTFPEFIGLLDFSEPRALGALFGTLEPDRIREIIGLIREIPMAVLSTIISHVPGLGAQEYRTLYRASKERPIESYQDLSLRAASVKWDTDWLCDCLEAEELGAVPESVNRLVAEGVRLKPSAYVRHSKIEKQLDGAATEREVARALLLARTTPLRAWVIRMARLLTARNLSEGKAWKLAGILARTQRPRTRKRLILNPIYLERIRARQPEIFEELDTEVVPTEKQKKRHPKNGAAAPGITAQAVPTLNPALASSISTMHRLLDISRWLPADVDLEHTQAIIVHGHLAPGQRGAFVGEKYHDASDVPENVRNKLSRRWSPDKFDRAHDFLMRAGVIALKRKGDVYEKLEPLGHISDPTGQLIARAWIAFAAAYKSR